jgi:hypothetical protein
MAAGCCFICSIAMNATLVKACVAFAPASVLLLGLLRFFIRRRTLGASLLLAGAGCLMVVILTHVCEGLRLLPSFRWGRPDSVGHYVDLVSAILAITLLPLGYALHALATKPTRRGDPA